MNNGFCKYLNMKNLRILFYDNDGISAVSVCC